MQQDNIMKYETILPEDFDGVFYFTNWSDEDFVAKWGGKEYLYPALTTSPMVILEHSPLEVQNIRKKFAKDLAEREYFKSKDYSTLRKAEGTPGNRTMNSIHQANASSIEALTPYIQKALLPLEKSRVRVIRESGDKRNIENELVTASDGKPVTVAVGQGDEAGLKTIERQ